MIATVRPPDLRPLRLYAAWTSSGVKAAASGWSDFSARPCLSARASARQLAWPGAGWAVHARTVCTVAGLPFAGMAAAFGSVAARPVMASAVAAIAANVVLILNTISFVQPAVPDDA